MKYEGYCDAGFSRGEYITRVIHLFEFGLRLVVQRRV